MQETRGELQDAATKLSDLPSFWVLAFAIFALVALLVIYPKHFQRQTRLERMNIARQVSRPGAADSGEMLPELAATDLPAPQAAPLVAVLSGVAAVAAVRLYFVKRRMPAVQTAASSPGVVP